MNLLNWITPLFRPELGAITEIEALEMMPRSERFPPAPPREELPQSAADLVERERARMMRYM